MDEQNIDEMRNQIKAMRESPYIAKNRNAYWSADDVAKLENLYKAGYGISEIAITIQRTEDSIIKMINDMGLKISVYNKHAKSTNNSAECEDEDVVDCTKCLCIECDNNSYCEKRLICTTAS